MNQNNNSVNQSNSLKRKNDSNLDPYHTFHSFNENNENQNDENFLQPTLGSGGEINMEVNKKYLCFSPEQVQCMCEALQQKNDIDKLTTFLYNLPPDDLLCNNESILRARAIVAYHRGSFHELYALLETHIFSVKYHPDLQSLWWDSRELHPTIKFNSRISGSKDITEKLRRSEDGLWEPSTSID